MSYREWIPKFFTFPKDCDTETIKKRTKMIIGIFFKNFKGSLYREFVINNKEPKIKSHAEGLLGGFQGLKEYKSVLGSEQEEQGELRESYASSLVQLSRLLWSDQ
jgi:hypothetical protein